tara:strand:+ start:174 stop:602 length:429 start_codon:yes stop_codon:yes gene_type:complete
MIQVDSNVNTTAFLDLKDAINGTVRPLIQFKSQQTNKSLFFMPTIFVTTDKDRFCTIFFTSISAFNIPSAGLLQMGTKDYPYGLYDTTIYKNSGNSNLNPNTEGVEPVYYTLMNLYDSTKTATTFTPYTTNDTDTNSVYITF